MAWLETTVMPLMDSCTLVKYPENFFADAYIATTRHPAIRMKLQIKTRETTNSGKLHDSDLWGEEEWNFVGLDKVAVNVQGPCLALLMAGVDRPHDVARNGLIVPPCLLKKRRCYHQFTQSF